MTDQLTEAQIQRGNEYPEFDKSLGFPVIDTSLLFRDAKKHAEFEYEDLFANSGPLTAPPATDFDTIASALARMRRVAQEDYDLHLQALVKASTTEERNVALKALGAATHAVGSVDMAARTMNSAQAVFRDSTLANLVGDEALSRDLFKVSGEHVQETARLVEGYANYAPKSRFMDAALRALLATDKRMSEFETKASSKVESFVGGLRGFAKRLGDFATRVKQVPDQVKEISVKKAVSTTSAMVSIATAFKSKAVFLYMKADAYLVKHIDVPFDAFVKSTQNSVAATSEAVGESLTLAVAVARDANQRALDGAKAVIEDTRLLVGAGVEALASGLDSAVLKSQEGMDVVMRNGAGVEHVVGTAFNAASDAVAEVAAGASKKLGQWRASVTETFEAGKAQFAAQQPQRTSRKP